MNRRTFLKSVAVLVVAVVFPIKTCGAQPTPPAQAGTFSMTFPFSFPEPQAQEVCASKTISFRSEKWLYRLLGIK